MAINPPAPLDTREAIIKALGARDLAIIELNAALQALGAELAAKDRQLAERAPPPARARRR